MSPLALVTEPVRDLDDALWAELFGPEPVSEERLRQIEASYAEGEL